MRVIKGLILMMGFFFFFGAISPIMGGGTDSEAQSRFEKPLWGTDFTVATGPTSGGISIDQDTSGNLYAVRCSTYNGVENAQIRVYKSTDGGDSWFYLCNVPSPTYTFSYPVVLTGSHSDRLYVFYLRSSNNGDIRMARFTQSGTLDGYYAVKTDDDTVSYFSVCTPDETGSVFMVAYQWEHNLHYVCTIRGHDHGETWGFDHVVQDYGPAAHPDIAYGYDGYVYLVFELGGPPSVIAFMRNTWYCHPDYWGDVHLLTADSCHDSYPKVADVYYGNYVWVVYNHDLLNSGNLELRYAYSTNGGVNWSTSHDIASSPDYDEMAGDLWVINNSNTVNVCYLKYKVQLPNSVLSEIRFSSATSAAPTSWTSSVKINEHLGAYAEDGRLVCQGTYVGHLFNNPGILYAGRQSGLFGYNFRGLYFDYSYSTDVEEGTEEELPAQFSLSPNYPNPFNPVTRIQYTVGSQKAVHGSQFVVRSPIPATLKIYNVLGQLVKTLVNEPKERGTYEVIWDGKDENGIEVASGIYFYKLQAGDFADAKKMLLLK